MRVASALKGLAQTQKYKNAIRNIFLYVIFMSYSCKTKVVTELKWETIGEKSLIVMGLALGIIILFWSRA